MSQVVLSHTLTAGTPENVAHVQENFEDIRDKVNGELDGFNLTQATKERLGLNDATTTRSGMSYIVTTEAIGGTSLAALATPDRVSNVAVAAGGRLFVSVWLRLIKTGGALSDDAEVGLFLNGTQVKSRFGAVGTASLGVFGAVDILLNTLGTSEAAVFTTDTDSGMTNLNSTVGGAADNLTAGHAVGIPIPIVVAPGTYTVELRYSKLAGGTIYAADRRLYVESRTC